MKEKRKMNERLKDSYVIDFYEKEALKYDEKRWNTKIGEYTDFLHKQIMLSMHKDWNNENILEIGMGTGRFTQVLAERCASVSAIDTSQSMIEITTNKLDKKGLKDNVKLYNASAFELPFKNSNFDGCISINVFSHLQNYERVIMEISRILKPGGFFIVNFPNLLSYFLPYGILVNLNRKSLRRNVFTHWYNLFAIRDIYFKSDLKLSKYKGRHIFQQ